MAANSNDILSQGIEQQDDGGIQIEDDRAIMLDGQNANDLLPTINHADSDQQAQALL